MSWKKFFKLASTDGSHSPINGSTGGHKAIDTMGYNNYGSMLPEVYTGSPNRTERYNIYESMDSDSEVNAALDILSEFSTQSDSETNIAFKLHFHDDPTETEAKILKKQLHTWYTLNDFQKRIFRIFRNVLKYGDQIFLRDPETFKLFYIDMVNVVKIIVNESDGKKPEQYVVRNINPNFENLTVTAVTADNLYYTAPNTTGGGGGAGYNMPNSPYSSNNRFVHGLNEKAIEAQHVVHLSLTEGLDPNWPFGNSILELIFKVFKQKELLEDAIIIYRIQRAPERRVFYIDVGDMPSHMAMAFVDRVKNEIHQRRIPTHSGGGNFQDSTYQPLCLAMDTKVPLLDGRTLDITELAKEYKAGKENWAYSCNPKTGEIVPGPITWAGITRELAEVIEITLDNDKIITCTPDHKIPVLNKGFVEAKDLTTDDCLIAFNTRTEFIHPQSKKNSSKYHQIFDHNKNKWLFTHRIVANFMKNLNLHDEKVHDPQYIDSNKNTIHHDDYNRFNNDPSNLKFMNKTDHLLYHSGQTNHWVNSPEDLKEISRKRLSDSLKKAWIDLPEEDKNILKQKVAVTARKNWKELSDIEKEDQRNNMRLAQQINVNKIKNNQEHRQKYIDNAKRLANRVSNDPLLAAKRLKNLEGRTCVKPVKMIFTDEMMSRVADKVKSGLKLKTDVIKACDEDKELLQIFAKENPRQEGPSISYSIDCTKWGYSKLKRILKIYNYKNFKDFVAKASYYNHRIKSIRVLENKISVGTVTIDGHEKYHNYHTFAVESGIFVKNSINSDFFFPQTSTGRGSKVETLPSGQNLGEIDDLRFFTNKMMRGLRIPSSYLPTGPDDSPVTANDGRVGTALIQEFRFNQYCQRLQNLIIEPMDTEFKAFLKWSGVNIDVSTFDLKFNDPQNFAHYRESELDQVKIGTFSQLEGYTYFSKRFLIKRYLGLSVEEMAENSELWAEENETSDADMAEKPDLRNLGITPGGIESDIENFAGEDEMGDEGNSEEGVDSNAPGTPGAGAQGANPPVASGGAPGSSPQVGNM